MTERGFKRKLTAILSADAVGYSRLMGEDEAATVQTITSYRNVISTLIKQHNGTVIDSPGDNLLAEFVSVVDAVQCAVAVQKELKARNDELSDNRRMQFRIGINLGDIIQEDDRIYGDGVNIAARLEGLADPGGICISKTAFDHIETKLPLGYEFLGDQSVKNISKPVGAYRVLMEPRVTVAGKSLDKKTAPIKRMPVLVGGAAVLVLAAFLGIWQLYMRRPSVEPASVEKMAYPLPDLPSIAVLPFVNMSDDSKQEYICDGLTEDIITALSKVRNMFVIARNSTFTFKYKAVKVQQVAEELGVRYVLEGSVRKSQDRLRINVQLIDAVKGYHLWAERYDRKLGEIFTLQDEVTKKILTALQVEIAEGEDARLMGKGTNNLEAYLKLLQARQLWKKYTREDNTRSQQLVKEAIDLDPNYAMAYRALGAIYVIEHAMGWSKFPEQSLERGKEMAQKAIALDNTLAEAYALLGRYFLAKRQYEKALAEGEKAYALDPNSTHVLAAFAYSLQYSGMPQEAVDLYQKAIRLDPIPPSWFTFGLGRAYRDAGRYEDAITTFKKLLNHPHHRMWAYVCLTATYSLAGRDEESHALAAEALDIDPKLSTESYINPLPYKDQEYKQRLIDVLHKAGLPYKPPLPLPDKPSIAVLPFENMSGDPEQEYFSDGIAENIITALSKVGELFVIARNSSFTYKDKPVKVQQVSRELGVRYVLEGSVQKSGDRVRITAQLIDAKNGQHIWAENYDRDFKNIFEIQDDITLKIVTALQVHLTAGEQARVWSKETQDLDVYLKSIQAYSLMREGKKESLIRYAQLAQEIVDTAPESPLGYRMLAWYHFDRWAAGISRTESYLKACEMAQKALSLNELDPYSHALFGWLYRAGKWWDKAIESGMRSVELEPNGAYLHCLLGNTLVYACRFDEALIHLKQAIRLNPFPPYFYYQYLGMCYFHKGQPQKALSEYEKALQLSSNDFALHGNLAVTYISLGREEEARESQAKVLELAPYISVGWLTRNWPFKCRDNLQLFLDAMRKAGAPE